MPEPDLGFFNSLSATLDIELSVPPQEWAPNLHITQASPEAKVVGLKLRATVENNAKDGWRDLTEDELNSVAFRGSEIRLRGQSEDVVSPRAPNGAFFTVRDLLLAVEETERQTRNNTEWLGGVDVHHICFEGIHADKYGAWVIQWGS